MYNTLRDNLMTALTLVLLAAILICGFVTILPTYRREESLKQQNAELQAKIDAKRRQKAKLTEYQQRFRNDSDFVEMIARRDRRVYPGELVFIFEDD